MTVLLVGAAIAVWVAMSRGAKGRPPKPKPAMRPQAQAKKGAIDRAGRLARRDARQAASSAKRAAYEARRAAYAARRAARR